MQKNNIIKKSLISSLVFLLFVIIVFYFIFKKNDIKIVLAIFKETNKFYIFLAILIMGSFSLFEALNLRVALKLFGSKVKYKDAYKYALAGFFVSAITPSSSGGDPVQLYLMTKDKIPFSQAVVTLFMKMLAFQFVTVTISLISFLTSAKLFLNLGNIKYLIFLGIIFNFLLFSMYFLLIFYKQIITFLVELVYKFLEKIHYQKLSLLKEKIDNQLLEYERLSKILKKEKKVFFKIILITFLELLLYYSIPYFVYLSFGKTSISIFKFISIQSVLFISVSSLPFPGAVGISELSFMRLYKIMYSSKTLASAMIITRFINFYLYVFYSGIIFSILILKDKFQKT